MWAQPDTGPLSMTGPGQLLLLMGIQLNSWCLDHFSSTCKDDVMSQIKVLGSRRSTALTITIISLLAHEPHIQKPLCVEDRLEFNHLTKFM